MSYARSMSDECLFNSERKKLASEEREKKRKRERENERKKNIVEREERTREKCIRKEGSILLTSSERERERVLMLFDKRSTK